MPDATTISQEEQKQLEGLVESLFQTLDFDIQVVSESEPGSVYFNFQGPDQKRLQDQRGETTRAIATLLQEYWARHYPEKKIQIRCDVDGEAQRQEKILRERALEAAESLADAGDSIEIGPFNSYERRIIHLTLQDNDAIETQSVGVGHQKRVKLTRVASDQASGEADTQAD